MCRLRNRKTEHFFENDVVGKHFYKYPKSLMWQSFVKVFGKNVTFRGISKDGGKRASYSNFVVFGKPIGKKKVKNYCLN